MLQGKVMLQVIMMQDYPKHPIPKGNLYRDHQELLTHLPELALVLEQQVLPIDPMLEPT